MAYVVNDTVTGQQWLKIIETHFPPLERGEENLSASGSAHRVPMPVRVVGVLASVHSARPHTTPAS